MIILVVDDEPQILAIVERFARQAGFEVETSANAVAALSDLSKLDPDVVLVDLQMPDIGGLDVLKAIRAADPECQVILMTGKPTIDTAIEAVKLTSECSPGSSDRFTSYAATANPCVASCACSRFVMWKCSTSPCRTRTMSGVKWLRIAVM